MFSPKHVEKMCYADEWLVFEGDKIRTGIDTTYI